MNSADALSMPTSATRVIACFTSATASSLVANSAADAGTATDQPRQSIAAAAARRRYVTGKLPQCADHPRTATRIAVPADVCRERERQHFCEAGLRLG